MRALVVYESMFGNTRDVAESVASGLRDRSFDVEVAEVRDAPDSAEGFDLLVVGGPIHAWSMTRPNTREAARAEADTVSQGDGIREWLERLPDTTAAVPCATFDTQTKTKWFPTGSAAKPAAKLLRRHGFDLVSTPEHFLVEGKHGPMIDGEIERARAWGSSLVVSG